MTDGVDVEREVWAVTVVHPLYCTSLLPRVSRTASMQLRNDPSFGKGK